MEIHLFKYDPELEKDILAVFQKYGTLDCGKTFYRIVDLTRIRFCIGSPKEGPASYQDGEVIFSLLQLISPSVCNLFPPIHFLFTILTIICYQHHNRLVNKSPDQMIEDDITPVLDTWSNAISLIARDINGKQCLIRILNKLSTMFRLVEDIFYGSPDACATFDYNNQDHPKTPESSKTLPSAAQTTDDFVIAKSSHP